jgi:serine/threonine-protein kinase
MGSYRLVERLGQGGMGEVWRAQHQRLARPAAIKLIRPSMLSGKDGSGAATVFQRFEREAQVTATLESANTVRLYDYGLSDDGSFYYVMELLRGLDLDRLVVQFGALSPARAVHLLQQACHSLSEAHAKGLIHRDIKPANIYACRIGQDYDFAKVLDFGLVKPLTPSADDVVLTQVGATTGTPAFLAPEMALGKAEIDARADVYSLGCVGYWLLTGKLLFQASSAFEMAMNHVQKQPLPPSEASETEIPLALDQIVLACLEKDPAKRPQSMTELSQRLSSAGLEQWSPEQAKEWWRVNLPALST